ncbi:hypothetical protein M0R45_013451 [Rubus argutus]|uniref:Uncharacterized protein n=1 Tax=Rubus argutus TaxID=59490 RepID=A0AAW1XJX3_RUBAR
MMNKFFKWVGSLFGREDQIPWCDREIILGCEREVAEDMDKGESREEHKSESIMRLSWALVHSRQPEDVERGIAMLLQAALLANGTNSPLHQREGFSLLPSDTTELVNIRIAGVL